MNDEHEKYMLEENAITKRRKELELELEIFKKDETLDLLATRDIGEGEVVSYDFDPTKGEIDILTDYGAFDVLRPSGGLELTLELDEDDFNFDEKCDVVELWYMHQKQ